MSKTKEINQRQDGENMKLTLYRSDLRPEFEDMSFHEAKFKHFNENAQQAIVAVGRAVFFAYDHSDYNAIFLPKSKKQSTSKREVGQGELEPALISNNIAQLFFSDIRDCRPDIRPCLESSTHRRVLVWNRELTDKNLAWLRRAWYAENPTPIGARHDIGGFFLAEGDVASWSLIGKTLIVKQYQ